MTDDQQSGNHGGDPVGALGDEELRALFGADIRGDQQDEDISEDDQRFLRGLFAADVATPPPSRLTVASILAAARAGDQPAGGHDPDTDRLRPVAGPTTPSDAAGSTGVSGQSGPPGFADRSHLGSPSAGASPIWPGDELGARRRRNIRTSLLVAAAVAAVVAIGVPIALNSGNTGQSGANSAAMPATSAAAGGGGHKAPEAVPQSGAASDADSGDASAAAGDSAAQTAAAGSAAAGSGVASSAAAGSATNGDLPAGRAPSGKQPMSAAPPPPSKGGAAPQRTGSQQESESSSATESGHAAGSSGSGGLESGSATGSSSASASGDLSTASCRWPELPPAVDQSATTVFGAGVVDGHQAISSSCLPARVAGAMFPAANGGRGAITVEVVGAAAAGSCAADHCRQVGNGIYVGQDRETTFVWLYQGEQQIKVGASTGLKVGQASLISFARVIGSIVR